MEDVVGKNGLMQKLFKDIIQQLLEAEMEEHLGRERHERNTDESLRKSLYLSTMKIMEKWTSPNQNWASTLGQLTIMFGERIPNSYTI